MPPAIRCSCDVCDAWFSPAESLGYRDELCAFCHDGCYPQVTISGKVQRSSLTRVSRFELHRVRRNQDPVGRLGEALRGIVREHGESMLRYAFKQAARRILTRR